MAGLTKRGFRRSLLALQLRLDDLKVRIRQIAKLGRALDRLREAGVFWIGEPDVDSQEAVEIETMLRDGGLDPKIRTIGDDTLAVVVDSEHIDQADEIEADNDVGEIDGTI